MTNGNSESSTHHVVNINTSEHEINHWQSHLNGVIDEEVAYVDRCSRPLDLTSSLQFCSLSKVVGISFSRQAFAWLQRTGMQYFVTI